MDIDILHIAPIYSGIATTYKLVEGMKNKDVKSSVLKLGVIQCHVSPDSLHSQVINSGVIGNVS